MIQLEELRTNLINIKPELMELRGALDLENGAKEAAELEQKTSAPGFWDEPEQSEPADERTVCPAAPESVPEIQDTPGTAASCLGSDPEAQGVK